jgi:two-component system, NarL family, response regulator LiaR
MIRVLIVDDHPLVRQGIRAFLEAQGDIEVSAEASSGKEAIQFAKDLVPDVVLMDLIMPEMDGVETTRRVKEVSPRSHVMMLTSYHDDEHIFPALRAGALSYILKDASLEQLAEAVRNTSRGEVTLHPRVAARVIRELHGPKNLSLPNPFTELTEREMNVLKNVAEGLSNADIATKLAISEYTVKGHVSNILSKLHLSDRTQAAVLAWKQGVMKRE